LTLPRNFLLLKWWFYRKCFRGAIGYRVIL